MLLRRFMTHIQSQNWFAVGLDITVVVVGIFLGLQATEWNEQRKENEEEKIILARLYDESFAIIQSLNGTILSHEENINAMEIAVKALEKKSLEGVDRNALRRGILTVIYFDALSLPRTVYDELTSTGKLGLLKSKTVTESIANYYARLNWLDRQVDFYRQSSDSSLQAAGNNGKSSTVSMLMCCLRTIPTLMNCYAPTATNMSFNAGVKACLTKLKSCVRVSLSKLIRIVITINPAN